MAHASVGGTRLYYERIGVGRPLVLLHGWGTSGRSWDAQLVGLAGDHTVVTVDWRGCGRSARPVEGNTIAGNAADVLGLCDVLELERPVLVGNSIGASFAIEAAAAAPERLGGIVSVNGPGYWPGEGMSEGTMEAMTERLAEDRAAAVAEWVPGWYAPGTPAALTDWTVRQILDSGVFINPLLAESAHWDPRPMVAALAVPAAFVHGTLDAAIPAEVSQDLAALAPRGTFHPVEGAAHLPQQERPAAFATALRQALTAMAPATV